jgi:hypothetical protein
MRQRFRWSFGILQAVWKHKLAFVRNKAMGLFALPNIIIFQMFLPLVSPFIDLMFLAGIFNYFVDRYYHPEAASAASFEKLLAYFGAFLMIDFITSSIAFSLERRHPANKGDGWLLFHIWLQRFAYRQLFSLVLARTVKRAIDGKPFNWDKIQRTAKMSKSTEAITETPRTRRTGRVGASPPWTLFHLENSSDSPLSRLRPGSVVPPVRPLPPGPRFAFQPLSSMVLTGW